MPAETVMMAPEADGLYGGCVDRSMMVRRMTSESLGMALGCRTCLPACDLRRHGLNWAYAERISCIRFRKRLVPAVCCCWGGVELNARKSKKSGAGIPDRARARASPAVVTDAPLSARYTVRRSSPEDGKVLYQTQAERATVVPALTRGGISDLDGRTYGMQPCRVMGGTTREAGSIGLRGTSPRNTCGIMPGKQGTYQQ